MPTPWWIRDKSRPDRSEDPAQARLIHHLAERIALLLERQAQWSVTALQRQLWSGIDAVEFNEYHLRDAIRELCSRGLAEVPYDGAVKRKERICP